MIASKKLPGKMPFAKLVFLYDAFAAILRSLASHAGDRLSIGGALVLGSGALGGDRLQGQEQKQRSSGAKSMPTKQSWSGKDGTWERAQKPANTNPCIAK